MHEITTYGRNRDVEELFLPVLRQLAREQRITLHEDHQPSGYSTLRCLSKHGAERLGDMLRGMVAVHDAVQRGPFDIAVSDQERRALHDTFTQAMNT